MQILHIQYPFCDISAQLKSTFQVKIIYGKYPKNVLQALQSPPSVILPHLNLRPYRSVNADRQDLAD